MCMYMHLYIHVLYSRMCSKKKPDRSLSEYKVFFKLDLFYEVLDKQVIAY